MPGESVWRVLGATLETDNDLVTGPSAKKLSTGSADVAETFAQIMERVGPFVLSLALDPPVPIQIYPIDFPPGSPPAPAPSSYPLKIFWGFPPGPIRELDPAQYPPGTLFVWSQAAEIAHGGGLANELLDVVPWTNVIPLPLHTTGVPMQWMQTNIHAQLGTNEQLIHSLRWAPDAGGAVPAQSDAAVLAFGQAVRDAWESFVGTGVQHGQQAQSTIYDEVRVAPYEQTVPNVSGQSSAGHMQQLRPTAVVPIASTPGTGGAGGTQPLPFEVALCVTLRTAAAQTGGQSHGRRNRGRVYLGGYAVSLMGSDGLFSGNANQIGIQFAGFANAVNAATEYHLAVHSMADLVARPVTRVQVGSVPDVIRKRRNAQDELYPVGTAVTT